MDANHVALLIYEPPLAPTASCLTISETRQNPAQVLVREGTVAFFERFNEFDQTGHSTALAQRIP